VGWRLQSRGDKLLDLFIVCLFVLLMLLIIYPLYWVIIASVSNPNAVNVGHVLFLPKGLNLLGYKLILKYRQIWTAYRNTIVYTGLGTLLSVSVTMLAGYALSRQDLVGRNLLAIFFVITLFFNGGLIPTWLVVKDLGMLNTIWAMIIPGSVSAFNILIARAFFYSGIPEELLEAARVDGCGDFRFFWSIVLPLSLPIMVVLAVFTSVGIWNSYVPALIYLTNESLYPLQMVLRDLLILNQTQSSMLNPVSMQSIQQQQLVAEEIQYGVVVVASIPMMMVYPFLLKYFSKGLTLGAVKG